VKHSCCAIIALCLFLAVQGSVAQGRGFGFGVILGEPTGISAKLWISPVNAFDFGVGWSMGGDRTGRYVGFYNGGNRVHIHMDYLWHLFEAIDSPENFPLYYGIGGRANSGGGYDASVAVRGVFGILWLPHDAPIDVFLELTPTLQIASPRSFGVDVGLGARYYF